MIKIYMALLTVTIYGKSAVPEPQPFKVKTCMLEDMYNKHIVNILCYFLPLRDYNFFKRKRKKKKIKINKNGWI